MKKWKRGYITVDLTVKEAAELAELLYKVKGFKRHRNKLLKASDWYFDYPFNEPKRS